MNRVILRGDKKRERERKRRRKEKKRKEKIKESKSESCLKGLKKSACSNVSVKSCKRRNESRRKKSPRKKIQYD